MHRITGSRFIRLDGVRTPAAMGLAMMLVGAWPTTGLSQDAASTPSEAAPMRYATPDDAPVNTWWLPTPDVLLRDGQRLTIGGLEIRVRSLGSGESPAATVYFIPSMDILVSGDILTPRRVPLLAAGRTAAWLEQVESLRRAYDPDARVLPGHGPATDLGSAADWQENYIKAFRAEVTRATGATSDAAACISAEEGERILATMRREHPTVARVARMPEGVLDALNLEGVDWELTGKTCPGTANPVRERRAGSR